MASEDRRAGALTIAAILLGLPSLALGLPLLFRYLLEERLRLFPTIELGALTLLGAVPFVGGVILIISGFAYVWPAGGRHFAHTPRGLCRKGPYAYVRSPIYLGTVSMTAGLGLLLDSWVILGYTAFFWLGIHIVLIRVEEPRLAARFSEDYERYRREVPRWIPALRRK